VGGQQRAVLALLWCRCFCAFRGCPASHNAPLPPSPITQTQGDYTNGQFYGQQPAGYWPQVRLFEDAMV